MWRAVAILFLAACGSEPSPRPDAGVPPARDNLSARPGAACPEPGVFCASYAGVCISGVCRAQCGTWPHCGPGEIEERTPIGDALNCHCVPAQ